MPAAPSAAVRPQSSHDRIPFISSRAEGTTTGSANPSTDNTPTAGEGSNSSSSNMRRQQVVGYYNSFHTHSRPAVPPPTYESALRHGITRGPQVVLNEDEGREALPPYECTVCLEAAIGVKTELSSPFQVAVDRRWKDVYLKLCGTQLLIYKLKSVSLLGKACDPPQPGKFIKKYSLQHAEVGIALDFKKTGPIPRSTLTRFVPSAARQKLYITDPHLFDPPREFALRLRAEGEQFLLCCSSPEQQLDWVEAICMAIDISMPLDERSEPRYRSLPRRTRRGRGYAIDFDSSGNPSAGRQLVEEQERILRSFYPNLAELNPELRDQESRPSSARPGYREVARDAQADPDAEDLDPLEMFTAQISRIVDTPPSSSHAPVDSSGDLRPPSANLRSVSTPNLRRPNSPSENDNKVLESRALSSASQLRIRRRCAPNLLASSPRANDVVFINGKRWRVNPETQTLGIWQPLPPRYSDHGFDTPPPKAITLNGDITNVESLHPAVMVRAASSCSDASGYEAHNGRSSRRANAEPLSDLTITPAPAASDDASSAPGSPGEPHSNDTVVMTKTSDSIVDSGHFTTVITGRKVTRNTESPQQQQQRRRLSTVGLLGLIQ